MSSLQTRLSLLITAIGTDVKALKTTLKILDGLTSLSDTEQPLSALEWRYGGGSGQSLTGKLVTISPVVSAVIVNRSELWARVKSRDGTLSADRLILDSDGNSFLWPVMVTALPTTGPSGGALMDGQECYFIADATNGVVWHLKYKTSTTKWHYVGGPPLRNFVDGSDSTTSNVFGDMGSVGPSITTPLAGDYDMTVQCDIATSAATFNGIMSYAIGGVAAVDLDGAVASGSGGPNPSVVKTRRKTNIIGGALIRSKYRSTTNGSTALFSKRSLTLLPVRLG